jgi:hypothetical protein
VRLSPEKIFHLSKVVLQHLQDAEERDPSLRLVAPDDQIRVRVRDTMKAFLEREAGIVTKVRDKIRSMKRGIPEGSAEWDALFRQFYREEWDRLRKVR